MRDRFPIFQKHPTITYLDNAATTQRVDTALDASDSYYREMNANVHRSLFPMAEEATEAYEGVREKVRDFVNARETEEIIFTRGTTEALNLVAQGWGRKFLKPGDEIVLTVLEHHSNLVPWQMVAKETGAVLSFVPILEDGTLDMDTMASLVTEKTKMVSVTGLSNSLGTVVDLERVVQMARKVGAKVCVDAAQLVAHFPVDVQALDVDFCAFSSHKMYGLTGAGVLYGKRELLEAMEPVFGGGDMIREVHLEKSTWNDVPWKFESGTPSIAQVIGMGGAIDFIKEVGFDFIQKHDKELLEYALERLADLSEVTVLGPGNSRQQVAIVSFLVKDVHPHDVAAILGQNDVCVRAGHHCTMPLMKTLKTPGTTRVSFSVYNAKEDIDRLMDGLKMVIQTFRTFRTL